MPSDQIIDGNLRRKLSVTNQTQLDQNSSHQFQKIICQMKTAEDHLLRPPPSCFPSSLVCHTDLAMRISLPSCTNCFIPAPSSSRHSLGTYTPLLPGRKSANCIFHLFLLSPLVLAPALQQTMCCSLSKLLISLYYRTYPPNSLHLYPNLEFQQTFHRKPGVTRVKKTGSLLENITFPSYPPNPIPQSHVPLWSRLLATMSFSSLLSFPKGSVDLFSNFLQTHPAIPDPISSRYSLGTFKLRWLEKQIGQ